MNSPVHVLMLSIQAVRGLPRLRAPGIVPCIIGADSTGATGNFAPVGLLTQEPEQTLRFAPVPFMAVL